MKHLDAEEKRDAMAARCKIARANLLKGTHMNNEVWEEVFGQGGIDLHDGWARIFCLSKMGHLHIFKRARLQEKWLESLSQDAKNFKEMTTWPLGTMPKANPFRIPFFSRCVVRAPEWDKVQQQWKVEFDCKPTLTFWFCDEYIKASGLDGWLTPRKQRATFPWERGGGIIKEQPAPKVWVPELNNDERRLLLEGNTSQVIRNLHVRHAEDLKEKRVCVMDIKDGVDKLLEAIKD